MFNSSFFYYVTVHVQKAVVAKVWHSSQTMMFFRKLQHMKKCICCVFALGCVCDTIFGKRVAWFWISSYLINPV